MQAALARVSQADAARFTPACACRGKPEPARPHTGGAGRRCLAGALAAGQRGCAPCSTAVLPQAQVQVQQAALEQARQAYQLAVLTAQEVEDAWRR